MLYIINNYDLNDYEDEIIIKEKGLNILEKVDEYKTPTDLGIITEIAKNTDKYKVIEQFVEYGNPDDSTEDNEYFVIKVNGEYKITTDCDVAQGWERISDDKYVYVCKKVLTYVVPEEYLSEFFKEIL